MDTDKSLTIPPRVNEVFRLVSAYLGDEFSLADLKLFTQTSRNKTLQLEESLLPAGLTGYCLALRDLDLVVVRAGLDAVLKTAVTLHELAHLLLGHVPLLSAGPTTPDYTTFRQQRSQFAASVYRSHSSAYQQAQEYQAELLATLFWQAILQQEASVPAVIRDFIS